MLVIMMLVVVVDASLSSGWCALMSTQLIQLELVRPGVCYDTWCGP